MNNCYVIKWNDNQFAILRTEQAALNLIQMFASMNHPAPVMTVEPAYIPNVGF